MILNLKRGILLISLGIILTGLVGTACSPGGKDPIPLFNFGYQLEKSKTGFFIIVPKGIAQ
ncbi:hypothetical protein EHQ81_00890 [Leptospira selangorensis]|uniref:Lipoprotein n=1 Tax=Leptospira selangorensis TaxID=2484982 RepID=A0A5F2C2J0_9LEPT|nr:hypothetical protein [Leptospira selangorensis]TGM17097.1 hypothetical protein EHQ81_00890 [Leptospira selangorensis]TGM21435.1 hypothetical protein EHQ82_10635 [Leptospira selangorensis]